MDETLAHAARGVQPIDPVPASLDFSRLARRIRDRGARDDAFVAGHRGREKGH
jgi:hypothetical protein